MNNYTWQQCYAFFIRVMEISFAQFGLALIALSVSYAVPSHGQESLNKEVSLSMRNVKLERALSALERSAAVKFAYSPRVIHDQQIVSLSAKKEKLSVVLDRLLSPINISYEVIGGRISLFPSTSAQGISSPAPKLSTSPVSGKVSDEAGLPLPGVNIVEKGTSNGVSTDADGNFTLNVSENAILVFTFIGYLTQEVPVNNKSDINITMMPDVQSLNEVVVVGYGTQEKKDLTGSVSSVDSDVLASRQSLQVSDALQGTMSGVTVTRSSGEPGGGSTVRVRGVTSLNVNDPLVIVDGVPGLGLNDVNPNDIENLTVLKDAASQAIYGARAAAGVILITTKRGKEGKLQLNYDYEYGVSEPTTLPKFVKAKTYRNMINERSANDGGGNIFDPAINDNYDELHQNDPDLYPDTDWQDLTLTNKRTNRQRHDLSMSIGTEKLKTRASLSYVTEDGLYANKNYDRYTFRVNNNLKMYRWLEANVDLYYKRTETMEPSLDPDVMRLARLYPGIYSAIRTDGLYGEGKDGENNLANTIEGGTLDQSFNQISGVVGVTITPLEGLHIRANLSPTYNFNRFGEFTTPPSIFRQGSTTESWPQNITRLDKRETSILNLTRQFTVNYSKTIKEHTFDFLAGYEEIGTNWEEVRTASNNLSVDLPSLTFGDPSLTTNNQFASKNALRSYFGRIGYSYKEKYLVQSNLRADASSRFAPDNRWGFFPSVSLGWVASNENFELPGVISFLKLRASYGEVGNERIGEERTGGSEFFNFYPYQSLYERTVVIFYNNTFTPRTGIRQDFLADRSIVWETTRTVDAGLDLAFFNDKLLFSVDYYQKNTDDIILTLDLPNYLGFEDDTKTNVGSMKVNGLDVEATHRGTIGKLTYSLSANATSVRSEVTNVGGRNDFTTDNGTKINIKGSEFNEWFGYQTRGIYQTQEDVSGYGVQGAFPGDIWIVDQLTVDTDGDGVPDSRDNIINERDRVALGASLPKFTYGGSINLKYGGFDMSLVFNGVGKHTRRYDGFQVSPFAENFGNAPKILVGNYWSPNNSPDQNLAASYPRLASRSEANNYAVSDFWLFNGGYFRMKNITVGYSLPASITSRARISQVRFYAGLRDYFTIESNFLDGWDPEASNSGYPIMKSVLFGVNVKL